MKANRKICGAVMMAAAILLSGCVSEGGEEAKASVAAKESQGAFPAFRTKSLSGEDVTNEVFARKKITVINIWGTFCPPCIGEMPELGEWARNMPKDAQLIGIVCDADGDQDKKTIAEARRILKEADADFLNLVPNSEIMQYLENVQAVPTTIFVDAEGKIVAQPVVGADVQRYKNVVKEYLGE